MINRSGIILPFALAEEEGCGLGHVASAYATAEALFDLPAVWRDIEDAPVVPTTELVMLDATTAALRLHVADLVRAMPPHAGLNDTKARLSAGIARLKEGLDELLRDHSRTQAEALRARLIEASAPAALVERIVALSALDGAVGIADLSASLGRTHDEMALANAYEIGRASCRERGCPYV